MLILLLSCSSPPSDPAPGPAPEAKAEPEPQPEPDTVYVQASTLKLRAESSENSQVLGKLAINTPLEELERQASWVKVRVSNGVEGWVVASYLAPEPLSADRALEMGQETNDLSWFQRAAAIESSPRTLEPLLMKYRTEGDGRRADVIARQLALNQDIKLGPQGTAHLPGEPWPIEWRDHTYVDSFSEGELTARQLEDEGLSLGETWWLLPASGPAVKGSLVRSAREVWNECGGDAGVAVYIQSALEEEPIAATRGEPPASWHQPGPQPKRPKEEAEDLVEAWIEAQGKEGWHHLAPAEGGLARPGRLEPAPQEGRGGRLVRRGVHGRAAAGARRGRNPGALPRLGAGHEPVPARQLP